jgi:hypothetical protein
MDNPVSGGVINLERGNLYSIGSAPFATVIPPAFGDIAFDSTNKILYQWNGSGWTELNADTNDARKLVSVLYNNTINAATSGSGITGIDAGLSIDPSKGIEIHWSYYGQPTTGASTRTIVLDFRLKDPASGFPVIMCPMIGKVTGGNTYFFMQGTIYIPRRDFGRVKQGNWGYAEWSGEPNTSNFYSASLMGYDTVVIAKSPNIMPTGTATEIQMTIANTPGNATGNDIFEARFYAVDEG